MDINIRSFLFVIATLVHCSACTNGNNDKETVSTTTATVAHEDSASIFAESEGREGGAAVIEQNEVAVAEAYLIADSCAGPFRIDTVIPKKMEGFDVTKFQEEKIFPTGETREISGCIYEIGNEGWVKVTSTYDAATDCTTDKTSEIFVFSDLFLTAKGIGAMSSIEEYVAAYPDFRIRYIRNEKLFVVEAQQLKNVQFIIDNEYYRGDDATLASGESVELQVSDFRKESHFTAIRITK